MAEQAEWPTVAHSGEGEVPDAPITPSDALQAALDQAGWTIDEFSWVLGYARLHVQNVILNMHSRITADVALRLEAAFGHVGESRTAEQWMDVQRDHDLCRLRDLMEGELAGIRRRTLRVVGDSDFRQ